MWRELVRCSFTQRPQDHPRHEPNDEDNVNENDDDINILIILMSREVSLSEKCHIIHRECRKRFYTLVTYSPDVCREKRPKTYTQQYVRCENI